MSKIRWKSIGELDYKIETNRKAIQDILRSIKPLKKYTDTDVPLDKLEKTIWVLSKKYNMFVKDINTDCFSNEEGVIWSAHVYEETTLSYYPVYGLSMYELLAKIVVMMYLIREEVGGR